VTIDSVPRTLPSAKQLKTDSTPPRATRQAIHTDSKHPLDKTQQTTEDRLKSMSVAEDRLKQSSTKLESFAQSYAGVGSVDANQPQPDAYVDSGLFDLSAQDIAVIAATPDLGDVLTRDGIDQTLETLGKADARDLADMAVATAEQTLKESPGAVGREAERILDRFMHHTDWSRFPPLPSFPQVPGLFG
jgi:hypothetical protein